MSGGIRSRFSSRSSLTSTIASPIQAGEKSAPGDIVILVMGPTGTGKSTLINLLTKSGNAPVSTGLEPCTNDITGYVLERSHKFYEKTPPAFRGRVILVDTPAFDGNKEGHKIIREIGIRMKNDIEAKATIGGMIYLFSVYPSRYTETKKIELEAVRNMCGDDFLKKVVFGLTGFNLCPNQHTLDQREEELKNNYWQPFISGGAVVELLAEIQESAERLLDHFASERIVSDPGPPLMVKEMEERPGSMTGAEETFRQGWLARKFKKLLAFFAFIFGITLSS